MQTNNSKILYNEYVMGDIDYYESLEESYIIYDDSQEWYNKIDESEADVWVAVVWGSVTVAHDTLDVDGLGSNPSSRTHTRFTKVA